MHNYPQIAADGEIGALQRFAANASKLARIYAGNPIEDYTEQHQARAKVLAAAARAAYQAREV